MEKILIASNNKHKVEEINAILKEFGFEAQTLEEAGLVNFDIEENGDTFEENSYIKAKAVLDEMGMITIADDTGLMVEYLGGAPGVYSARYAGEDASYEENNRKLLANLNEIPYSQRKATFVSVITMLFPDGRKIVARGELKGYIALEYQGEYGFGYDPLFYIEEKKKTLAQCTPCEKNRISHRANALKNLRLQLESL